MGESMLALVTGASSGIGYEMIKYLSKMNIKCIAVSRNVDSLYKLNKEIEENIEIISLDLSIPQNCINLYNRLKHKNIDIVINNAGVGVVGDFLKTSLENELSMIDLNVKATHILTKLFLQDMIEKNRGYILNVSSIGACISGPLISSYYATKSYILNFTKAINIELKTKRSKVYVGVACPGPVDTQFNKKAGVDNLKNSYSSEFIARYIINEILERKTIIIPGIKIKIVKIMTKILPSNLISYISYRQNNKKINSEKY